MKKLIVSMLLLSFVSLCFAVYISVMTAKYKAETNAGADARAEFRTNNFEDLPAEKRKELETRARELGENPEGLKETKVFSVE